MFRSMLILGLFAALTSTAMCQDKSADTTPLAGTKPLTAEGDIAAQLVAGVDKFLLRKLEASIPERAARLENKPAAVARLKNILGARDPRVKFESPELIETVGKSAIVFQSSELRIRRVRWPVVRDVMAEGLLIEPVAGKPSASAIAIPDADQTPEQIAGLVKDFAAERAFGLSLAKANCRVLIPTLISRKMEKRNGRANLSSREYLYRQGFELGRGLIGYELQTVLAAVDWMSDDQNLGVIGYGEGGMLALYAAAVDERIKATCVSGYFGSRQRIWEGPIDRNVFGLLEAYGDAELAELIAPRSLIVENSSAPQVELTGSGGGAPAVLKPIPREEFLAEVARVKSKNVVSFPKEDKKIEAGDQATLAAFVSRLLPDGAKPASIKGEVTPVDLPNEDIRQARLIHGIESDLQQLLDRCEDIRRDYMKELDTSSLDKFKTSVEAYREKFDKEVIGRFDDPLLPFAARSRKAYDTEKWVGYEVTLDVFPDVIAYGILCLPKDLKAGEKRPVVVCQHGLEGRPQDVIGKQAEQYYSGFAGALADRGFITFAPQNLYIGRDNFRTLQRKANPLGKTLFSVIVPQHRQIVRWLAEQPFVDKERIAFYGLSYGGKSAMRIPPLVTEYCLSICSADFNEWVFKNASTRAPYSYVGTPEYEIFEWDLGGTFNYAEMAALICPRPFMVERGHFDGVGVDEQVGYEYAKVQHLYAAKLKIPNQCEIEWFDGPHKINGQKTYDFLHKHLKWPKR